MKLAGLERSGECIDLEKGKGKRDRTHIGGSIRKLIVKRKNRCINQLIKRKMLEVHHQSPFG
jgi:hypothetical protein